MKGVLTKRVDRNHQAFNKIVLIHLIRNSFLFIFKILSGSDYKLTLKKYTGYWFKAINIDNSLSFSFLFQTKCMF